MCLDNSGEKQEEPALDADSGRPIYTIGEASGRYDQVLPAVFSPSVIFKYNPHRMRSEDVLATLVGREELLSQLLAHLRAQRGRKRPKHIFLFGPRGIGKTTMLLALRHTISGDPGLSAAFDVIQFSEEERRIANLPAFAVRTLELLARLRHDLGKEVEQARATPDAALAILLEAAARVPGKQVLLLLDNFDELAVAVSAKKAKRSRGKVTQPGTTLQGLVESPRFTIVASAIQSPEKRRNFPRELLKHFEPPIQLKPISDAMSFLRKRAEQDRRKGFLEDLPRFASRIEGLNRLAGGNPRLLVFLYDCLGHRPLLDLVEIVQKTADDLTPMYQDVIDRLLNRGQAAVLEVLAAQGGVGTPGDLAKRTFQDEQTVRTFLGNLCDLGLVVRSGDYGFAEKPAHRPAREIYRTDPPLFQIWYEMRHLNREESLYLVHFFSLLAAPGEVHGLLADLRAAAPASTSAPLSELLEDVADVLDPEWGDLQEKYVRETLRQGGSLRDSLQKLDEAIEKDAARPPRHRVGLLVVRSEVRQGIGDTAGAAADLEQAEVYLREPNEAETLTRVLVARSGFLLAIGETEKALETAEAAEDQCGTLLGATAPAIRATVLLARASAHDVRGEYREALGAVQQAREFLKGQEEPHLQARVDRICGNIKRSVGEYSEAERYYQISLQTCQHIGDRSGQASSLNGLGIVYESLGDYKIAREYFAKSLALEQEIGNPSRQAISLNNLGIIHKSLGDYERAREYYEKSLAITQEIGNRSGQANALGNLGNVCQSMGDYKRAREYCEKSLAIEQEIGNRGGQAISLNNLGNVYRSLGKFERAREYFGEAHRLFSALGERPNIRQSAENLVRTLFELAAKTLRSGEFARAEEYVGEAASYARDAGPDNTLSAFLGSLVVPTLQHSRDLAGRLLESLDSLASRTEISADSGPLKAVRAVLLFYSRGESPAEVIKLGPAELFLVQSVRDRIERPLHVKARDLIEAREPAEAAEALQSILNQSPDDVEALLNLSSIRMAEGRLDDAESLARKALAERPDLVPAALQLAEIERERGRRDRAIQVLQEFLKRNPSQQDAYAPLARDLRQEGRFEELAGALRKWRDVAGDQQHPDPKLQESLDVWIPEAEILAGHADRAQILLPSEDFRPRELELCLLLGLLRVLLDLRRKDAGAARKHAAEILTVAIAAPPGKTGNPLSRELAARAREMLGDTDWEFLSSFAEAVANQADPRDFAREMLDEAQAAEFAQRFAEEEKLALQSLKDGRIQGFRDLLRTTTRSIGPAAAIRAFGAHYAEYSERTRSLVAGVLASAIEEGKPPEVTAALHAIGENFPKLEPKARAQSIHAMLSLAGKSIATPLNREQGIQLLNVLYPNLTVDERRDVRNRLEAIRKQGESPALAEFFGKTVPTVEKGE